MRWKSGFIIVLASVVGFSALCQENSWVIRITFPKKEFLPGEPIPMKIEAENKGPECLHFHGFFDGLYLDDSPRQCGDRRTLVMDLPPKGHVVGGHDSPGDPPGAVHAVDVSLDVACASISGQPGLLPGQPGLIGPHHICYKMPALGDQPAMEGCGEFTIVRPLGADAEAYKYFKGEPLKHREEVIKKFPTSTYAALALWQKGYEEFQSTDTTPGTAADDLHWGEEAREEYSKCINCQCEHKRWLCLVIPPWETLSRQFPDFPERPRLLFCLSRAYLLIGWPEKSVPLLQELLSKFPDSEAGKKAVAYRDVLKAHGMWPE